MRGFVSGLLAAWLLIGIVVLVPRPSEAGTWTCGGSDYTNEPLTEVVQNGGFEDDLTHWYVPPNPTPLPTISTTVYHTGAKSAWVHSYGGSANAVQDLDPLPSAYVLSYWFYVGTWGPGGAFDVELLSNWDPSSGSADYATSLAWFPPNTMRWWVWRTSSGGGASQDFARTLTTGVWHLIETVIDGSSGRQCLYIDGGFEATLTVDPATTFEPTVIAFGDISWSGDAGDGYWDDISIQSVLRPDYVPENPQPSTAIQTGESIPTLLSIDVRNRANMSANTTSTVAFYNESTPGSPFATFPVPALADGASAGPFTATWTSPSIPGTYRIVAEADYGDTVDEMNEANNVYTWTAVVHPPPITTLIVGAPSYAGTYVTSATPLTLSVEDRSGTGIRRTEYQIDTAGWRDYTLPFTLAGEGDHLVEWFSEDNVGNVEAVQGATLTVDDTPPTTTLTPGTPNYGAGFITSSTPITLAATDGGVKPSGVDGIEFRIDAGFWSAYSSPFTLAGEGAHTVAFRATDNLGNLEPTRSTSLTVDDSGPMAAVTPGVPSYVATDTWITSATPVSIVATDLGVIPVGLDSVDYHVWSGAWSPWSPYAFPFTVPPEGRRYVEWRASDLLGNTGAGNASLIVDDTPPTVSLPVTGPSYPSGGDTWITSSSRIALSAVDGGVLPVGLGVLEYRTWLGGWSAWTDYTAPIGLSGEGRHYLEWRASDFLGNSRQGNVSYVVDDTPPTVSLPVTGPSYPSGGDTWITSSSRIALSAVDGGVLPVGLDTLEYRLWFDGWSLWADYTAPIGFSEEGRHYLEWRADDLLGNTRQGNASYVVDDTPPTSSFTLSDPHLTDVDTFVTSATGISVSSVDAGVLPVGLGGVECSLDSLTWTPYAVPILLTGPDGPRSVYCRGTDRLGNVEAAKVLSVVLDNAPPTTTLAVPQGTLSIASRFSLSATDAGSGVDEIEYRVDGGAWRPYNGTFALPIGEHVIRYRSTDRLGNQEPERAVTVRVENWKPIVAFVFAVVLAVVAVLLTWRARRMEGSRWKRLFVGGIVFAAAEAVTGVLSALLGVLPIPPFLDLGTTVDGALLVAGLVVVSFLYLRARPRMPPPPPEGITGGSGA